MSKSEIQEKEKIETKLEGSGCLEKEGSRHLQHKGSRRLGRDSDQVESSVSSLTVSPPARVVGRGSSMVTLDKSKFG